MLRNQTLPFGKSEHDTQVISCPNFSKKQDVKVLCPWRLSLWLKCSCQHSASQQTSQVLSDLYFLKNAGVGRKLMYSAHCTVYNH